MPNMKSIRLKTKELRSYKVDAVIETTSCYQDYLLLLRINLVISRTTSCYQKHLLLSRLPLVIGNTACYRKAFLSDFFTVILNWLLICPGDRSVTVLQHFRSLSEFMNEAALF